MKRKRISAFLAGLLCGVMLMGCAVGAFAAAGGSVSFGSVGLAINNKTVIKPGETLTNANGYEIPSAIVYTDEQGGGTTYLPIRKISELLDIPVTWKDGMVYLGYGPRPAGLGSITIGVPGDEDAKLLAEQPLHGAGAKAGPYTELEPYWPTEEEITGWSAIDDYYASRYDVGATYHPLGDEGYCAISITNTADRDLILSMYCPGLITHGDWLPSTVVPAGETVVRTFHADAYTGGLYQRGIAFSLGGNPSFTNGIDTSASAKVTVAAFVPKNALS